MRLLPGRLQEARPWNPLEPRSSRVESHSWGDADRNSKQTESASPLSPPCAHNPPCSVTNWQGRCVVSRVPAPAAQSRVQDCGFGAERMASKPTQGHYVWAPVQMAWGKGENPHYSNISLQHCTSTMEYSLCSVLCSPHLWGRCHILWGRSCCLTNFTDAETNI